MQLRLPLRRLLLPRSFEGLVQSRRFEGLVQEPGRDGRAAISVVYYTRGHCKHRGFPYSLPEYSLLNYLDRQASPNPRRRFLGFGIV